MTVTATSQMPRVGVVFRPQLPPERLRGYLELAESAGLDDVWLWEDCFAEGGLTTAAAALAWTGSLRIGLGLMPAPMRNPALAAMEVATLARLFPGRFVPAAGHGVQDWMQQIGGRVESPVTLLREWVTAVRSLLHGQAVTISGRYVRLDGVTLAWPPAVVPPLLVGARGRRTLALAGEHADGLVLDAGIEPGQVRQAVATAAARRPHEVVVYLSGPAAVRTAGLAAGPAAGFPGEPGVLAGVIRTCAEAGATTVVIEPAAGDPDPAATIRLAGAARAVR